MAKYKTCVYAICKNEEKFIKRWYESVKDSDYLCILDTGSTDNSINICKSLGIKVKQKIINPWRFDKARNESLKLIPKDTDICICLDLDEVLVSGWKEKLNSIWDDKITRINYTYNWYIDENNIPKISFYCNKIHKNKYYKWINPVHEVLEIVNNCEKIITCDDITINHYPDRNKSRSSYLPLLELSIKEDPTNDRNMHYLGREYMYYKMYDKAIDTLIKHLLLEKSTWKDERCASMRFIGRCYKMLKRYNESEMWYKLSIKEAPYLRDGYMELALLYSELGNWNKVIYYVNKGLKIKQNNKTYINELFCFNETPYDLLSIAYYYTKKYNSALKYVNKALEINNNDDRLLNNKILIEKSIIKREK